METKLTYDGLAQENERLRTKIRRKEERILYLERMLFGSKRDKAPKAADPVPVIGGNHVGADLLAQMVVDKYCHHLPEYRQVKMIGQIGVRLPVSTVNRWVHATANKLYPLYESLCEDTHMTTTPSDLLGKAIDYAYKLWPRMRNYTLDGRYHLDNNDVERGQRPSVLGRKNYLFSQNDRGAEDNAIFYRS